MTRARLRLGAAVLASVCAVYAADRDRPVCSPGGTSLPKSAAGLLNESEASAANGIQIGRALGALGEAALPDLRLALRDGSVPMQRVALYALGEIGPNQPRVMTEILPFVTEGKTREVRLNALNALGKLGAHAADAVPTILGSVTDNDGGIRTEARRALVKIGLAALPATDASSKARSAFFTFEGWNDNLEALHPGHTLAEENKHYGRIQANATVADLVRMISSPSKSGFDRDFALKDLARVGPEGKAALPALLAVLANDPGEGDRELAAQAIGALGADAATATEPLATALNDREADVRFSAAWALASIGAQSLPALEKVLTGGTPAAQLAAIRALEMLYTRPAWAIVKRYWERSGMRYPYDDAKLRAIIGEPR